MGTYPWLGDSRGKPRVIPDDTARSKVGTLRGLPAWDRPMSYQLVGEVTAHQGDDG